MSESEVGDGPHSCPRGTCEGVCIGQLLLCKDCHAASEPYGGRLRGGLADEGRPLGHGQSPSDVCRWRC